MKVSKKITFKKTPYSSYNLRTKKFLWKISPINKPTVIKQFEDNISDDDHSNTSDESINESINESTKNSVSDIDSDSEYNPSLSEIETEFELQPSFEDNTSNYKHHFLAFSLNILLLSYMIYFLLNLDEQTKKAILDIYKYNKDYVENMAHSFIAVYSIKLKVFMYTLFNN
jgi:hypothetical protein